ncbi:response regulator [Candidatus Nitrospira bockiana]
MADPIPSAVPPTVLVVDDDPSMLRLCAQRLEEQHFRVLQASGSTEALKICAEHRAPIHLLIADLFLPPPGLQLAGDNPAFPRVHGSELVHQVLARRPETRVLLISAYSEADLNNRGITMDPLPFLRKPFSGDALIQAARAALSGPPVVLKEKKKAAGGQEIEWFD